MPCKKEHNYFSTLQPLPSPKHASLSSYFRWGCQLKKTKRIRYEKYLHQADSNNDRLFNALVFRHSALYVCPLQHQPGILDNLLLNALRYFLCINKSSKSVTLRVCLCFTVIYYPIITVCKHLCSALPSL